MSHSGRKVRASALAVLVSVFAVPVALAQGITKEGTPGGVELKPQQPQESVGTVPKAAAPTAPAPPPAPAVAAPSRSPIVAPKPAPADTPSGKSDEKGEKKKFWNKSGSPSPTDKPAAPITRGFVAPGSAAPAAPAAGGSPTPTPSPGGDESKPGAVERSPAAKTAPQ